MMTRTPGPRVTLSRKRLFGGDSAPDDVSWPAITAHRIAVMKWLQTLIRKPAHAGEVAAEYREQRRKIAT
jgi:hypothetical protein